MSLSNRAIASAKALSQYFAPQLNYLTGLDKSLDFTGLGLRDHFDDSSAG
jgi:hypothetical protein